MKFLKLVALLALSMPFTSIAKVNPKTTQSTMVNVVYSGCINAVAGKADSVVIDFWTKGAEQYGKDPSFDKMYKNLIEDTVLKGSRFHREYPDLDCTQIYINTIDSLENENEALKKQASK